MLANNDPTTNPIIKTQKTGKTIEVITGGNCLSYTEKYTTRYITIIQNMQTNRVRNIVMVPPILKNLYEFKENI